MGSHMFCHVSDLHATVKYAVSGIVHAGENTAIPEWLDEFSSALQRIVLEDQGNQNRVRHLCLRLSRSEWQPVKNVQVTPYLDNAPVGQSSSPAVLWTETKLYVRDCNVVEMIDDLVSELQRPFELAVIGDAIRVCIDRTRDFVSRYLETKFELEVNRVASPSETHARDVALFDACEHRNDANGLREPALTGSSSHSPAGGHSTSNPVNEFESAEVEPEASSDGRLEHISEATTLTGEREENATLDPFKVVDGNGLGNGPIELTAGKTGNKTTTNVDPQKRTEPHKPPLLERYVKANGFVETGNFYALPDGSRMLRSSGIFTLDIFNATGQLTKQIWLQMQSLANGLEVPAEVWEMIRSNPDTTAIVFENPRGEPTELSGSTIHRMLEDEHLRLFPARYRLKQIAGFSMPEQ
jgi:hypothetical protein